jgi:hypothetical protein
LQILTYQYQIIQQQNYRIYDFKEDMFGNALTLFKYYKNNEYEDAGEIWIRQKNHMLSLPLMLQR